ncbi:hypothetical protein DC20_00645 [Rufibacter tibetensis]|uniref:Uncharacterized protein n=1 Tax=Rufibacter tibetensis TaxID=512763 RepID=A0A0P0CTZ1_9BACT|nr:hypothetical protein DC20_00645 [Rufibacter tibetensis]
MNISVKAKIWDAKVIPILPLLSPVLVFPSSASLLALDILELKGTDSSGQKGSARGEDGVSRP